MPPLVQVVKLALFDFELETGALKVRRGKGGKDRTVYLDGIFTSRGDRVCGSVVGGKGSDSGGAAVSDSSGGTSRDAPHDPASGAVDFAKAGQTCGGGVVFTA